AADPAGSQPRGHGEIRTPGPWVQPAPQRRAGRPGRLPAGSAGRIPRTPASQRRDPHGRPGRRAGPGDTVRPRVLGTLVQPVLRGTGSGSIAGGARRAGEATGRARRGDGRALPAAAAPSTDVRPAAVAWVLADPGLSLSSKLGLFASIAAVAAIWLRRPIAAWLLLALLPFSGVSISEGVGFLRWATVIVIGAWFLAVLLHEPAASLR